MSPDAIVREYREAYATAYGETPTIELVGSRFRIANRAGDHTGFTARDVGNLIRGLRALAGRRE